MKNTIVLVDDNEDLLEVCVQILEKQGFEVVSFTSVIQAKDYLNRTDISCLHAIVSDLMMGPVDGLDFLSYVKSVPALADIDFFLMTGALLSVFEPYSRSFVIKGVIHKPFSSSDLVTALTFKDRRYGLKVAA